MLLSNSFIKATLSEFGGFKRENYPTIEWKSKLTKLLNVGANHGTFYFFWFLHPRCLGITGNQKFSILHKQ